MPDHLAHSEVEEYSADGLKLSAAAAHIIEAAKESEAIEEDYDMSEHHHHHQGNGDEYAGEHEYGDYDMGDADMEHQSGGEYADNVVSTDAGSILATQDNGEEQLLDDEAQQGGEYAYEGEEPMDEGGKTQEVDEHGHPIHQQSEMYDDQGAHLYGTAQDDASGIDYSMMAAGAADTSSLVALSHAITSNNARQHAQDEHGEDLQHEEDHLEHGGVADDSPSPLGGGSGQGLGTPMRFTSRPLMLDANGADIGPSMVTPAKRQHSVNSGDGSATSRLKSKVWSWYDIVEDGQRQCRFCMQKYGRLTATTILARHYHNRHDPNPPPLSAQTPSHRPSSSRPQQHLNLSPVHAVYSQAAAAAAVVAAAAAATPDAQAPHLFHPQTNGALNNGTSDDLLHTVSEANSQHAVAAYDDSQLIIQEGFSSMMTAPLSRIGLSPARKALAAVAQFCAQADPQKNLQTCVDLITTASRRGARMVFLPESSDFILETRAAQSTAQHAQGLDGSFMKEIQQAAKDNSIWVSIGIHEQQQEEGSLPFNTNAVVSDEGTLVSIYRKLHLFDVSVKDGPRITESQMTAAGDRAPDVVDTPLGKLGLAVCYDVRFPEIAQHLRHRGAQLLCYPSAFTEMTGAAHWEVMLRARAIETQTYVFAAAQIGKHNAKRSSYGDAMIVDPWGAVVARCSRNSTEPTLVTAEVNLNFLDKVRREMPVFNHKRVDIFH
ncbi:Carbon-nitrogen hydrolase [Coemansia sp. S16]|nr:Carbon-nitrogen hydrolase [Coemansia sp. S680]KAJ2039711.1 Carbon-nitrogen hydrolase [Coemansia sp. S3946]KAJ2050071.1 Carbon-nitrogen hydrolase [Coemansia sp. S16]KAJ2058319.1 Carbon-nitrogen hydrolase [Coemansia sp. S2]KAJ2069297.1 Carbon-nitrogen hydrolase [Coemansia sp. S155-1]